MSSSRVVDVVDVIDVKILLALFASTLLVGCVGISRPSTQLLEIRSEPPGALAELSIGRQCVTPCKLVVPRKDHIDIKFSLQGYQDVTTTAVSKLDAAGIGHIAGNIATGSVVLYTAGGIAFLATLVDALSGGGGIGPGIWITAGAVCAYLVYASARDASQGKARSLQPNPIEVKLQPIPPATTSRRNKSQVSK